MQDALNSGIIFTNKNCIGCNKCISVCPVTGANVVVKDPCSERYSVLVDPNRCILCGQCVNSCVHKARTYRDDTEAFLMDLEQGENISVLISPTLLIAYEKQYNNILGYLKELGVKHIYNTGFGADLMLWVYMNFIKHYGLEGVISQTCPVIVNYLEKYRPELLKYLVPVQSPVMCTAIYLTEYLNVEDKLAYISPCIAGKYEIEDVNTYGKVVYNVTFERLLQNLENVDISKYYAEDEVNYGLGSLISTSGGLSENIKQYVDSDEVLIQTSGPSNIFPYFDHYYYNEINKNSELPFMVDAFSCTDGCNFGTGTNFGYEMQNQMSFSTHRAKIKALHSGNAFSQYSCEERLEKMNERFKEFELSSFVRQYDNTRRLLPKELTEEEFNEAYLSMYKEYYSQRHTDCGSCGYKTCEDMAYAVGNHINYKENCINYSKERISREIKKTNTLLEEISGMNEELKTATQLKSNFLANMSHEIRTPMNAIIGMAEIALRGDIPEEERSYLQQIKVSGNSLVAIINDILDFSKIESGRMEINEVEYTVMSLIRDTVNMVLTRIGEKDITLIVNAQADIPIKLLGDDIRIKQILINLANNAVKFTESGFVKICMTYERSEDGVDLIVSVEDSGIGIKQEDQEKLFNSFLQVDSKRNRNIEGTGLGLAISQEFVHLMGGEISLQSTYGEGSIFSFRIPQKIVMDAPSVCIKPGKLANSISLIHNQYLRRSFNLAVEQLGIHDEECHQTDDLEEMLKKDVRFLFIEYIYWGPYMEMLKKSNPDIEMVIFTDPRKEIVSSSDVRKLNRPVYCLNIAAVFNGEELGTHMEHKDASEMLFDAPDAKILIVDDNAINLTVAIGLLAPMHMQISDASSGKEAIALIDEEQFDIVFMDHMMPEMDGIEATHIIRSKAGEYYKNLPIIALTANAINNARELFLAEGMNDFVAKPIDMVDIMSKLRRWLPKEKIKKIQTLKEMDDEQSLRKPKKQQYLEIEGLDSQLGISLVGTEELYKKVLADYYAIIEKKADLIEKYEEQGDIGAYTIEVHALKSASKLIGAEELSDLAALLEKCGNDKDTKTIKEKTPKLLQMYRSYRPILEPYAPNNTTVDQSEKTPITKESLTQKLRQLYDAVDNFDIDMAKTIMQELEKYLFEGEELAMYSQLMTAVEELEYDEAVEIAENWIEFVQK